MVAMQISNRKNFLIGACLILYAAVVRVAFLAEGTIPFAFDHGKDSLAALHMLKTFSPAFIGPWTSIPGLYFGPAWYYMVAGALALGGLNPVAPVVLMSLLILLQVYIAYRYFGFFEGLIAATVGFWLHLSTSAWNPFPMTLLTFIILVLLKKIKADAQLTPLSAGLLAVTASFGFHFSAAFAIFYPVILVVLLLFWKVKLTRAAVIAGALGYLLPFLPQLAFELKHNFVEVRAVLAYFAEGESHAFTVAKIYQVWSVFLGELRSAVTPRFPGLSTNFSKILETVFLLGVGCLAVVQFKKNKELQDRIQLFLPFFLIPLFGFFFLHFNVWYVYAVTPVVVLLVAEVLRKSPRPIRILAVILFVVSPIANYHYFVTENQAELQASHAFLPIKERAIQIIRDKAAGRPFASYHYLPDIYDFPYQYLYFEQAYQGMPLPTEFSYKPGEVSYIVQKNELLTQFPAQTAEPEVIFFIVEKPQHSEFLERWWGDQKYGEVVEQITLSDSVELFVATPATPAAELGEAATSK